METVWRRGDGAEAHLTAKANGAAPSIGDVEHPGFHAHLVLCDAASPGGSSCDEVTGPGARTRICVIFLPLLTIERQFILFPVVPVSAGARHGRARAPRVWSG